MSNQTMRLSFLMRALKRAVRLKRMNHNGHAMENVLNEIRFLVMWNLVCAQRRASINFPSVKNCTVHFSLKCKPD
jgi:hypothetical protein